MLNQLLTSVKILLVCLPIFLFFRDVNAQPSFFNADSAALARLNIQHQNHVLSNEAFLDAMEPLLRTTQILTNANIAIPYFNIYKKLAWEAVGNNKSYKAHYYYLLGLREEVNDRLGTCFYYFNKMYQAAVLHKDTLYMLIYYDDVISNITYNDSLGAQKNIRFYEDTIQMFTDGLFKNFINLPAAQQKRLYGIYLGVGNSYIKSGDTIAVKKIIQHVGFMRSITANSTNIENPVVAIYTKYCYAYLNFKLAMLQQNKQLADFWLRQNVSYYEDSLTQTDETVGYDAVELYKMAYSFYASNGNYNEADVYIKKITSLLQKTYLAIYFTKSSEKAIINKIFAEHYAHHGNFSAAYQILDATNTYEDSALKKLSADRDNILYALNTADETHEAMELMQAEKIKQQQMFLWLMACAALLAIGLVGRIVYLRGKHQNRLLQNRLDIARNLHDEIGPVMFYAKTLVKSLPAANVDDVGTIDLVEQEMQKASEMLRSISHDIKDTGQLNTEKLATELNTTLKKIGKALALTTNFATSGDIKQLDYNTYSHIRAIVSELIINSIKHAGCDTITINLNTSGKKLSLIYTDNGIGLSANNTLTSGIGIANIMERSAKIGATVNFLPLLNNTGLLVNLELDLV